MRQPSRWLQLTCRQEFFLKRVLIEEARLVGPSMSLLVKALWTDAVVETARDVYQLLRLPGHYGAQRLETACKRAAYYQREANTFTIEWILQNGYDKLPLSPLTDIRGRFAFAFDGPDDRPRCDP